MADLQRSIDIKPRFHWRHRIPGHDKSISRGKFKSRTRQCPTRCIGRAIGLSNAQGSTTKLAGRRLPTSGIYAHAPEGPRDISSEKQ